MSKDQEDISQQPLVIVRRRRSSEEGHHGGVWKIAYADFMTAMMAFFLVMWLINAADKKTIVQVAAYFNPIRLTDRFAAPKGLDDAMEMESKQVEKKDKKGVEKQAADQKVEADKKTKDGTGAAQDEEAKRISAAAGGKSSDVLKEQALFDNPGDMLDKLATQARASFPSTAAAPVDGNLNDPFDRVNRKSGKAQTALKPADPEAPAPKTTMAEPGVVAVGTEKDKHPPAKHVEGKTADSKSSDGKASMAKDEIKASLAEAMERALKLDDEAKASKIEDKEKASKADADKALAEKAAADKAAADKALADKAAEARAAAAKELQSEVSRIVAAAARKAPGVEVKATPEGLLVSLLDDQNFGMFEVGSAKPRPELVLVMEKLGGLLKGLKGKLVVRGHTDSRAYRNGVYDNWRLSAARAQMAHLMLVRGGVPEANFTAIEGRADRDPKIPADTEAAQNRRIDILIKQDEP